METDLKRIYRLAQRREKDNRNFLRWLKYRHSWTKRQIMALQQELSEQVWAEIDCRDCGNCCAGMQLQLTGHDCAQVAKAVDMTTDEFNKQYTEKHGDGYWYLRDQPCAFQKNLICTIYEDRPSRCSGFPYLDMPILEDMAGTLDKVYYCPIVFNVVEEMKAHPDLRRQKRRKRYKGRADE